MPSEGQLAGSLDIADHRGLGVELATPVLGDRDLPRLERLLARLQGRCPGASVIANDWGVVRLLRRYPELQPVAGRVMHTQLRDPRVSQVDGARLGGGLPRAWGLGAAISDSWRQLARSAGIRRVELDWPAQGLDVDAWGLDLGLSLHLPQVLVASGRACIHRDPRGAVDRLAAGEACARRCLVHAVEMIPPWPVADGERILRRGNAEMVELEGGSIDRALAWVRSGSGPDRVIVGGF